MSRYFRLLIPLALVLAIFACQDRSIVTQPPVPSSGMTNSSNNPAELTTAITLDSAIFSIFVDASTGETITGHRITADWQENVVTWNSFGEAFDPASLGSYVSTGIGFHSINITPLVQAWLDGTVPNFGLLLKQDTGGLTAHLSSEEAVIAERPMLTLYFNSGGPQVVTIQRGTNGNVADTYIRENEPTVNFGSEVFIYTGVLTDLQKQILVKFELPTICDTASVGDFVWLDGNCNGIQDIGEVGAPGVLVGLFHCSDSTLVDTMRTDLNGHYLFQGLTPGDYFLRFILPDGFQFSPVNQGTDDCLDSDVFPNGYTACFTLDTCEVNLCEDAGLCRLQEGGCTLTIGFWKTHAGFGPQADVLTPLLPIWLGTPGGLKSLDVTTALIAVRVLSQNFYGAPSNGITKLYAQLLGAKLNIENGASDADVAAVIAAADAFLATHNWLDWNGLSPAQKQMVLDWQGALDDYNEGLIGPGHCDEEIN